MSRPARARGLKLLGYFGVIGVYLVAPRAGAWIETATLARLSPARGSRPARARGLKLGAARTRDPAIRLGSFARR